MENTFASSFKEQISGTFDNSEFRHPKERWALIICWGAIALLIAISTTLTFGMVLILAAIGGIFIYIQRKLLMSAAEELKAEGEYKWLYDFTEQAAKKLGLSSTPHVFITGNPTYNAFTSGVFRPFIVVNSGILDICEKDEIEAIVAHELGHIKFKHVFNLLLVQSSADPGKLGMVLTLPLWIIGKMLFFWSLFAEYSADRTALWVCRDRKYHWTGRDMHPLVRALLKISRGGRFGNTATWEDVEKTFKKNKWDIGIWIAQLFSSHPHIYRRAYFSKEFYEKFTLEPPRNTMPGGGGMVYVSEKEVTDQMQSLFDEGRYEDALGVASSSIKSFIRAGKTDAYLNIFRLFINQMPKSSIDPESQFTVAKQLQNNKDYQLCVQALRNIALCHHAHPLAVKSLMECSYVFSEFLHDYQNALTALEFIAKNFPNSEQMPIVRSRYEKLRDRINRFPRNNSNA